MIRKTMIVVLTLAAVATGTIGAIAASGCGPSGEWDSGDPEATGYSVMSIMFLSTRYVWITHFKYLDGSAPPSDRGRRGPGWFYRTGVVQKQPSGRYVRVSTLSVSFVFPIVISILFVVYPAIAFIRGPVRRYRRRRKVLCLKCGYDLTANVSGMWTGVLKQKAVKGLVYGVLFGAALGIAARLLGNAFCQVVWWLIIGPFHTATLFCRGEAALAWWPYIGVVFYGSIGLLAGCIWGLCAGRRRSPPNCCQNCGYDLTGNVSGVCPECGVKVKQP